MKNLSVYIEVNGSQIYVGKIAGNSITDAYFQYAEEYYTRPDAVSISINLPVSKKVFTPAQTKIFFEGLLPEGFTRRCVASWMHADENDYLTILAGLGSECLGALQIVENDHTLEQSYKKLTFEQVRSLAQEGASESAQLVTKSHLSLTGASGKVGLYFNNVDKQWYHPIGSAPSTHIVKQSHVRLKEIVTNEQLCLLTASGLGIEIPESFIINTGNSKDGDVLFATKRYDRSFNGATCLVDGLSVPLRLHQEDFAQAMGIAAQHKYEHDQAAYLKKAFEMIRNYSANPMEDQIKLWDITVYNYLIGNTDNHIKNLSLLYSKDLKAVRLAPAYDIVSTMIYESSTKDMSLSINGKYEIDKLTRDDFKSQAQICGLGEKIAMSHFDKLASLFEKMLNKTVVFMAEEGFSNIGDLKEKILSSGGYHHLL